MSDSTQPDARQLMELALDVMRQSQPEQRADGKATPRVGAVIWRAGEVPVSACRGELREGDHAEYTLIERKLRDAPLRGAVLFCTLEPCAPGARQAPKLSCAERIVRARIKEVWVGIEDPDPTVDRRGIRYLQANGVEVHLFDRDLQRRIREENTPFLEQAMARAEAWEDDATAPAERLSELESELSAVELDDLSSRALDRYRTAANIDEDQAAFTRRLLRLGLLCKAATGRTVPTGFGFLLFGGEPRTALAHAGVLGTIHFDDGREEVRNFDGPQVFAPEEVMAWLRARLPDPIDRSGAEHVHLLDPFYEMVREAVVNAIIHRDYGIAGAKCQIGVTPDCVTVMSPGLPVEPVTLEQMQALDAPMLSRNPVLHYVFSQMKLAEERGLGLKSLRLQASRAQLPPPRYRWQPPYLVLTIYRSAEALARELAGAHVMDELNVAATASWRVVASRDSIRTRELVASTGFDERKAQRALKALQEAGLLRSTGSGPATRYAVPDGATYGRADVRQQT